MSIVLHWWHLPIALAVVGVVLLAMTRNEGGMFPWPTWHFMAGCFTLVAAAMLALGGLIS